MAKKSIESLVKAKKTQGFPSETILTQLKEEGYPTPVDTLYSHIRKYQIALITLGIITFLSLSLAAYWYAEKKALSPLEAAIEHAAFSLDALSCVNIIDATDRSRCTDTVAARAEKMLAEDPKNIPAIIAASASSGDYSRCEQLQESKQICTESAKNIRAIIQRDESQCPSGNLELQCIMEILSSKDPGAASAMQTRLQEAVKNAIVNKKIDLCDQLPYAGLREACKTQAMPQISEMIPAAGKCEELSDPSAKEICLQATAIIPAISGAMDASR